MPSSLASLSVSLPFYKYSCTLGESGSRSRVFLHPEILQTTGPSLTWSRASLSLPVFVDRMSMPEYMLRGLSLCLALKQFLNALSSRAKRVAGLLYASA